MKRSAVLVSILLIGSFLSMDSCKDNRVRGCTDPDSYTFDPLAERNDGSCLYEGHAVFWYDAVASAGLTADGAKALTFYLNGDVIGSSATTVYWTGAPDCGDNGSVSVTQDLGSSKKRTFTLSVRDQDNYEYWKTPVDFEANSCLALKLTWQARKKK
jgi:hypothetical protein